MKKKLTLSIDNEVIEKAKIYAKKEATTVSSLVENYLKLVTSSNYGKVADADIDYKTKNTPLVNKMRGLVGDHKITGNERMEYLLKKYG